MSPEQKSEYIQQEQYEAEDRRAKRLDKVVAMLNACDASDSHVIVEVRRGGRSQLPTKREQRKARKEYGYAYTHENLGKDIRFVKIVCMRPSDVFRSLYY